MSPKGSILVLTACLGVLIVIALSAAAAPINALPATLIRWIKPDPDDPLPIGCENIQIELEVEVIGNDAPVQYVQFSRWDRVRQEYVVIGIDDSPPYCRPRQWFPQRVPTRHPQMLPGPLNARHRQ